MEHLIKVDSITVDISYDVEVDPDEEDLYRVQFSLADGPLFIPDLYQCFDPLDDELIETNWWEERFTPETEVRIEGKRLLHLYRIFFGRDPDWDQAEICYVFLWDDLTVTRFQVDLMGDYQDGTILRQVSKMSDLASLGKIYFEVIGLTSTSIIIALNQEEDDELDDCFKQLPLANESVARYFLGKEIMRGEHRLGAILTL